MESRRATQLAQSANVTPPATCKVLRLGAASCKAIRWICKSIKAEYVGEIVFEQLGEAGRVLWEQNQQPSSRD